MNKIEYKEYLADSRWKSFRDKIIGEANRCECCKEIGFSKELNLHHIIYIEGKKPWEYERKHLAILCKDCHKLVHDDKTYTLRLEDGRFYITEKFGMTLDELCYCSMLVRCLEQDAYLSDSRHIPDGYLTRNIYHEFFDSGDRDKRSDTLKEIDRFLFDYYWNGEPGYIKYTLDWLDEILGKKYHQAEECLLRFPAFDYEPQDEKMKYYIKKIRNAFIQKEKEFEDTPQWDDMTIEQKNNINKMFY